MGKGKTKTQNNLQIPSASVSSTPSIFTTLFADVAEQNATVSIFSDSNPFRRKTRYNADNGGGSPNPDVEELKKRKRGKEKKHETDSGSLEEVSQTPSKVEKVKKKLRNLNVGITALANDNGGNTHLDALSKKYKGKVSELDREPKGMSNECKEIIGGSGLKLNPASNKSEVKVGNPGISAGREEEIGKQTEKRKKRKRDDLEREYEVRKYGAAEEPAGSLGGKIVGEKRKVVDNPADMLVSKEGFDNEDKLLRTVFVGNLPLKVKKKALAKEFSQFGEVESVRIRSVPIMDSKKPRKGAIISKQINESVESVHAYIVFKTEDSAQASLSHNMAVVAGNHIRVDRACPPRKKMKGENALIYDHKRTVFVGNLPFDVKDEEVYQLFCGINNLGSSVEAVRVIRDPHRNLGKGFAYVLFKTREAANLIAKKRNLKLRDRELRIFHAKPNLTPSKRTNDSQAGDSPAKKLAIRSPVSYEGVRASKSGVRKKVHARSPAVKVKSSTTTRGEKPKEGKGKRPAVAARKAKVNPRKEGGTTKQSGIKRKLDSRTPDSSHRNKKVKRFR